MPHRRRLAARALVTAFVVLSALAPAPAATAAVQPGPFSVTDDGGCWWLQRGVPTAFQYRLFNESGVSYDPVRFAAEVPAGYTAEVTPASAPMPASRALRVRVVLTAPPGAAIGASPPVRLVAVLPNGYRATLAERVVGVVDRPAPPVAVTATPGDGSALVTWTPGPLQSDLGNPSEADRRRFTVTASPGGAQAVVVGATSARVAGLANGTPHTFTVSEWNPWGTTESTPSAPVVPAGVPAPVTGVTVAGTGDRRVVSWTAPDPNGSPITGYTVTRYPDGATAAAPPDATSAEVTGVPEGVQGFSVRATNALGAGAESTGPHGRPGPFTGTVELTRGHYGVHLVLRDPVGGPPSGDGWEVVLHPSGRVEWGYRNDAGVATVDVGDLDPGTSVAVTVRAWNDAGPGPATPMTAPVVPVGHPGDVLLNEPVAGDGTVDLCFGGAHGGGADVTGYVVTSDEGRTWTVPADARRATLTGVPNHVRSTFTMHAVTTAGGAFDNGAGSVDAVPVGPPPAVGPVTVTAIHGSAVVEWPKAPEDTAGVYEVVAQPGGAVVHAYPVWDRPTTSATVPDLTNGTTYTFTVRGFNEAGAGPATVSGPATPVSVPGPVPDVTATAGPGGAVVVTWSPPAANGSPVTGYTVGAHDGSGTVRVGAGARTATLRTLQPGRSYWIEVSASNAVGDGPPGVAPRVTPDATPPAVSVTAPPAVTLSGTAGIRYAAADAASYDVRYRVARYDGGFGAYRYPAWWQRTGRAGVATVAHSGRTYCFGVRARDAAGNVAAWSPDACATAPVDDAGLAADRWSRGTSRWYYEGTSSTTATPGAELRVTGVRARRLALVATTCDTCGSVGVYLDGTLLRRVSLWATATAYRQVFPVDLGGSRTGTVTIRALRGRVTVDGVAALRH